jgi:hypothetical protein
LTDDNLRARECLTARQAFWGERDAVRQGNCKLRPYELEEVGDIEGRRLLHLLPHGDPPPSPRRSSQRTSPSHGPVTPTSHGRSRLPFRFGVRMPTQAPKSPSPSSTSGPTAWVSWWTAVAAAGLRVEFLHEFAWADRPFSFLEQHDDRTWVFPAGTEGELPLFFSLKATKAPTS